MKKPSNAFNKAAKGALIGAGGAVVAGAILPVLPVALPVIAVGAGIGAWFGFKH